MADLYSISGLSYEAKRDPRWFAEALLQGYVISNGLVTVLPNVKTEIKLNLMTTPKALLQANEGDCGWNPTAFITLNERSIEPKQMKINLEQCLEKFRMTYVAEIMAPGADLTKLPADLQTYTMNEIAKEINKEVEELIWNGDTASSDPDKTYLKNFDGWVKLAGADEKVIDVVGTDLTVQNIVGEVGKVYAAIPDAVIDAFGSTVKIFMNTSDYRMFKMALASVDNMVVYPSVRVDGNRIFYLDVELVPCLIAKGVMYASYKENMAFATDLMSDYSRVELGSFPKPNDDKIYVKGKMSGAVNHVFGGGVVLYKKA